MKALAFSLLSGLGLLTGYAQGIDPESTLAASYFQEAQQASQQQTLWPKALYGPMLFVDPQSRKTWSNSPDSAGILKPAGTIYAGILPKEVMIANTAIRWQGQLWSVILWPLPQDRQQRLSLLLHESFHRIQEALGLPIKDPTVNHLSTMNGRIYFLLELQALKAALSKPVDQRQTDLTNALLFRAKRGHLFPKTYPNERILEMNEGLAEFTGVLLGRQKDSIDTYLLAQINQAAERKSLIRSVAYITGPIYGYLLYQKAPRWTSGLDARASFPDLIARYYRISAPKNQSLKTITRAIRTYDGQRIVQAEQMKERERQQLIQHYVDQFSRQPVLVINLIKMQINFNPNTLFDLGTYGTVYPTASIKDNWGQLEVEAEGMLMKDWKVVSLSMSPHPQVSDGVIIGRGWKVSLNKGWKLMQLDSLRFTLTPSDK